MTHPAAAERPRPDARGGALATSALERSDVPKALSRLTIERRAEVIERFEDERVDASPEPRAAAGRRSAASPICAQR